MATSPVTAPVSFEKLTPPSSGTAIRFEDGLPVVPNDPIIPFIRGDGTGVDIWPATQRVLDAAVAKAYGGERRIEWFKVYAGDEACDLYGTYQYLPEDTLTAIRTYGVAIKGPLTTPIGGGIRSLNVALRQIFDLYCCVRPCRYYAGTPSPHKRPQDLDVIVYRENTEDIYMGIEWEATDPVCVELIEHLNTVVIPANGKLGKRTIPTGAGIGIKPVSKHGSQRHIRKAIQHALRLEGAKRHVTLVHKGNIMKFTEGAFRDWGYELATTEFRSECVTERESWILDNLDRNPGLSIEANARMVDPGYDALTPEKKEAICAEVKGVLEAIGASHGNGQWKQMVMVDDRIADSIFQQIQTRPQEYAVLATLNLNGDYISDAAAAVVGGLGMAPGANIGDNAAIFEATHGTAPKHAGLDRINPGSVILSGVMMLEYMGWQEAADLITEGLSAAIANQEVTYDLARLMEPPVEPVSCSGFARAVVRHFGGRGLPGPSSSSGRISSTIIQSTRAPSTSSSISRCSAVKERVGIGVATGVAESSARCSMHQSRSWVIATRRRWRSSGRLWRAERGRSSNRKEESVTVASVAERGNLHRNPTNPRTLWNRGCCEFSAHENLYQRAQSTVDGLPGPRHCSTRSLCPVRSTYDWWAGNSASSISRATSLQPMPPTRA